PCTNYIGVRIFQDTRNIDYLQSKYNGNTINNYIDHSKTKGELMAKGRDTQKNVKKKSEKTLKEKRKEKKAKKGKI
ncbi:MAG: hypothetical protein KAR45_01905, partial [Desulfobacteraceae bacterium]|nr:hypothetical protein [Desulfobacteraceae bacterium]